jgi:hypothetical protein
MLAEKLAFMEREIAADTANGWVLKSNKHGLEVFEKKV